MPDWRDRLDGPDRLNRFDGLNWLYWLDCTDLLDAGRLLPEFPCHARVSCDVVGYDDGLRRRYTAAQRFGMRRGCVAAVDLDAGVRLLGLVSLQR